MDLDILAVMGLRDNYDRYARFVQPSSLSDESWNIFVAIGEWYKTNKKADTLDWQAFGAWLSLARFAKMDKTKLQAVKSVVGLLVEYKPNEDSVEVLLQGLAKRDYASQIAEHALRIADGDYQREFDEIDTLIHGYHTLVGKIGDIESKVGMFSEEDLASVNGPGLEWRLKCLRKSCGLIRKGDFIVFGKRPDTGGTTFVSAEATYMAEQLSEDLDVAWFNNEESGNKVRRRIVQAATQFTSVQMDSDLGKALKEYDARMGRRDRIKVVDEGKLHYKDVERYLKRNKVGLIVFDQLWKVKGFGPVSADMMTTVFNWGRELCKEYAPIIAVHQAGADGANIKWIEQEMLYYGKTGPQGEADVIITMGRLTDRGNTRYLYVPKNKMTTIGDPAMRNGRYEITLDADRARFTE